MTIKFRTFDDSPRVQYDTASLARVATDTGCIFAGDTFSATNTSAIMLALAVVSRMGLAYGKLWTEA